ncbi:hypothetical protein DCAR_0418200 [Daucus carota subsp. sativus]|uniref:DOMON domain-containing protein n=1 Tax=Daucus carota subsp. sativus TaxID=79200 RepID=A0A165Z8B3_DAUCS|nr:PREDICTED: cytochrome b561 and DOMON domain-containing protein At5g47530-like [Daucus carota subsp. sativus]WOG98854.1 hypothetical protein DCAR_0418200 [Daucus carota subsp. sativus]
MALSSPFAVTFSIFASLFILSSAQTCKNYTFTSNRMFNSCLDLPYHHAHLHWNYFPSTDKLAMAYRARQDSKGWVAWAINPTKTGMVGAQALVAFHNSNGSMTVYPTPVKDYNPSMLPGTLTFQVANISAEYKNNEMIIFAVLGPLVNITKVNHVWQSGFAVSNNVPQMHEISSTNLKSFGDLDFLAV